MGIPQEPPDMPDMLRSRQPMPLGGTTDMEAVLRDFPALPVVTFRGGRMVTVKGEADFYAP
jgi:hypothetical protein